eukprot:TRINITY_DN888_c0_g1_i3.p2 TRINITY_DN888_c0_g1~~TRINITY_DN888_c0_g1_i3.p2  ORF type:complete len:259 (+),score=38.21 TRINITY_DN888_c0_g1_i3:63-839(+)
MATSPISSQKVTLPKIDLGSIKLQLEGMLGDKKQTYFDCLREFTRFQKTKAEFDTLARSLLGMQHYKIHELFIAAIIQHSQQSLQAKRQAIGTPSTKGASAGKKIKLEGIKEQNEAPAQPETVKQSLTDTQAAAGPAGPSLAKRERDFSHPSLSLALSDNISLHSKMQRICLENALRGPTEEAVALMRHALEYHMKDVIANCVRLVGRRRVLQPGPQVRDTVISVRDLHAALQNAPHLLGEDLPVGREKISALLYHPY